ncbi:MAG: class I SAM-dependent methyltransferase [Dehalococcoidia bacterium]
MTERARAVGRYFDEVADSYASRYDDAGPAGYALAIRWKRLFEQLAYATGPMLDAGCGPGLLLAALAGRGERVVGVDLSLAMTRQAAQRAPAVAGALEALPFGGGRFGVVIAAGAVEYVADDRAALGELARLVRPGGLLLATFPNRFSPYRLWKNGVFYPLVDQLRPLFYRLRGVPRPSPVTAYHHHYTPNEVANVLAAQGLEVEKVVYLNQQVLPSPLDEWLPDLSVALSRWLERWSNTPIGRFGTAFLMRARRPG